MFVLINMGISFALSLTDSLIAGVLDMAGFVLYPLYVLAVLVPSLAVGVRRLHDTGKSGWYMLVSLVPCIGGFYLLFLLIQDGTPGDNEYGPDPLTEEGGPTAF